MDEIPDITEPSAESCRHPVEDRLCILRPGHVGSHAFERPTCCFEVRRALADEILLERGKQETKNPGTTCASSDLAETDRLALLVSEVGEISEEVKMLRWPWTREARTGEALTDSQVRARLRKELLQVSAICMAWIEHVDDDEAVEGRA